MKKESKSDTTSLSTGHTQQSIDAAKAMQAEFAVPVKKKRKKIAISR